MTIAEQIMAEGKGDSAHIDRLCDERFDEIHEESNASVYRFVDGSRIRVSVEGAEIVS